MFDKCGIMIYNDEKYVKVVFTLKKTIASFITGALIFGSIGVFAGSYVANPVDFKVMVNGKEFTSDPPPLEVDGRTYLPLRAIGDALGVPVGWNEELRQAEVGTAPLEETSYSRNNPAPLDTVQTYTKNEAYSTSNYSAAIRVIETVRGEKAWEMIKASYSYNKEPKEGYEYIVAKVAFSLLTSQNDKAVSANSSNFSFYSGNNEEYETTYVTITNELSTNLFVGGNAEGYIVGMVKKDDTNPKLVYGLSYDGTNGSWFALQ